MRSLRFLLHEIAVPVKHEVNVPLVPPLTVPVKHKVTVALLPEVAALLLDEVTVALLPEVACYLRLLFLRRTELVSARICVSSSRSSGRISPLELDLTAPRLTCSRVTTVGYQTSSNRDTKAVYNKSDG